MTNTTRVDFRQGCASCGKLLTQFMCKGDTCPRCGHTLTIRRDATVRVKPVAVSLGAN